MAEYRIISRGEGFRKALDKGYPGAKNFEELLNFTPEPLLEPLDMQRLRELLRNVPAKAQRRTERQRIEAQELADLVRTSSSDALCDDAKEILIQRIEGKAVGRRGRPLLSVGLLSDVAVVPSLAAELKHAVELLLADGLPLDLAEWGLIEEKPETKGLPLKLRALTIARDAMQDRGYNVPSLRRLQNRIAEERLRPVGLFVKAQRPPE